MYKEGYSTDLGYQDDLELWDLLFEKGMGDMNTGIGASKDHHCLGHLGWW